MPGDALETSIDNFLMPPSRYQPLLPGPPEAEALEDARLEGGSDVMSFPFFTSFTRSLTNNPFNFLLFSLHTQLILLFYFSTSHREHRGPAGTILHGASRAEVAASRSLPMRVPCGHA